MAPTVQTRVKIAGKMVKGDLNRLSPDVRAFILSNAKVCQPESIHICDGSEEENGKVLELMEERGMIRRLAKYENW